MFFNISHFVFQKILIPIKTTLADNFELSLLVYGLIFISFVEFYAKLKGWGKIKYKIPKNQKSINLKQKKPKTTFYSKVVQEYLENKQKSISNVKTPTEK